VRARHHDQQGGRAWTQAADRIDGRKRLLRSRVGIHGRRLQRSALTAPTIPKPATYSTALAHYVAASAERPAGFLFGGFARPVSQEKHVGLPCSKNLLVHHATSPALDSAHVPRTSHCRSKAPTGVNRPGTKRSSGVDPMQALRAARNRKSARPRALLWPTCRRDPAKPP
jgi:hypothetical protein